MLAGIFDERITFVKDAGSRCFIDCGRNVRILRNCLAKTVDLSSVSIFTLYSF